MSAKRAPRAVITGGSSGLGLAAAREFARRGFEVVTVSRRPGTEFPSVAGDLADPVARGHIAKEICRQGPVDILINNAGIGAYATWESLPEAELRRLMEVDFMAPVLFTRELLPALRATRGTIVNIASVSSHLPVACMGAYGAAKAALWMYSESLRMELARDGVHVLSVCPGRIDTGFSSRAPVCLNPPPETPGRRGANVEKFARAVFHACRKRRRHLVFPGWYRFVIAFARLFPGVNEWGNRRIWNLNESSKQ